MLSGSAQPLGPLQYGLGLQVGAGGAGGGGGGLFGVHPNASSNTPCLQSLQYGSASNSPSRHDRQLRDVEKLGLQKTDPPPPPEDGGPGGGCAFGPKGCIPLGSLLRKGLLSA